MNRTSYYKYKWRGLWQRCSNTYFKNTTCIFRAKARSRALSQLYWIILHFSIADNVSCLVLEHNLLHDGATASLGQVPHVPRCQHHSHYSRTDHRLHLRSPLPTSGIYLFVCLFTKCFFWFKYFHSISVAQSSRLLALKNNLMTSRHRAKLNSDRPDPKPCGFPPLYALRHTTRQSADYWHLFRRVTV